MSIGKLAMAALALGLLASCGGSDEPCAPESFSIRTTWTVVGGTVSYTFTTAELSAQRGINFQATPSHTGIPSGCQGKGIYSLAGGASLPNGLSLNASTGQISGVPTGGSVYRASGVAEVSFPGFGSAAVVHRVTVY